MDNGLIKISLIAEELGVSTKTVYNWINLNKLGMPKRGYVNRVDAHQVWLKQQSLRSVTSFFMAIQIPRGTDGKFSSNS